MSVGMLSLALPFFLYYKTVARKSQYLYYCSVCSDTHVMVSNIIYNTSELTPLAIFYDMVTHKNTSHKYEHKF